MDTNEAVNVALKLEIPFEISPEMTSLEIGFSLLLLVVLFIMNE